MTTKNETTEIIIVGGQAYALINTGGRPVYRCEHCKAELKTEKNLRTHPETKTHRDHEANSYFWDQRSGKYLDRPFVSLLNPPKPKFIIIEWATSKFYNDVWSNMTDDEKFIYTAEHDTTICEVEEHHYSLKMGI